MEERHGVELSRQGGVATITLRRPETRNALTPAGMDWLGSCFDAVAANSEDRVLVLTGAGDSFCSGADLKTPGDGLSAIAEGPVARGHFVRRSIARAQAASDPQADRGRGERRRGRWGVQSGAGLRRGLRG